METASKSEPAAVPPSNGYLESPFVLPTGAVVSIGLFLLARKLMGGDKCKDVVVKDLGTFLDNQQACYDHLRSHQGGKPSGSTKTLKESRQEISTRLKSLTNLRERISKEISIQAAEDWKHQHLEWKDAMLGDSGFITEKGSVCPVKLMTMEKTQAHYQKFLVALRQDVVRGRKQVTRLSITGH